MKKILWLLVFAILFGNLFAGLSLSSYTVTPSTLKPGGNGVITLTVSNPILTSGVGSKVTSIALSIYPPGSISSTDKVIVGDLDIGSSTTISIPFSVKSNTKSGVYIFEIRAVGYTATGSSSTSTQSNFQAATIPISIVDSPIFSISSNKEVVGDMEPIILTITNNGGPASKIRVSVNSTEFALIGQDEEFIESITKSGSVNITLDSRNADDGANDVYFMLKYQDEIGNDVSEKKSVRLTVKKEKLDMDFVQLSEIITRKDSTLKLGIKNSGKSLENVRISFGSDSVKLKEASEFKLGNLQQDAQTEISLPVFTTLSPGTNYVDFNVKYLDQGVEKEQTVSVPITVTSDADVAVYLDAKPAPLATSQEHTLSVLVSNIGSYEISSVDVELSSSAFELMNIQKKEYIGGLDKDDFSTVQFKVKVKDVQPDSYPINITVTYRDKSGEWKTKEILETIVIHKSEAKSNGVLPFALGVIALAAVAVWYFKFRKKPVRGT